MADAKLSALPAAGALDGSELVYGDQGGASKKLTTAAVAGLATKTTVGLSAVTNDAQTKAAVMPNTAPAAGRVPVGNAGGTAYAPVALSGDVTMASTGATTIGAGKVTEAMQVLADNTTADVSTTKHGYAPKAPNDATKYLDGTGTYSVPAGGGGGSGTVTDVSVSPSGGITASVATSTTTPVITITGPLIASLVTYYVDAVGGNDANDGLTALTAFQTSTRAALAVASLDPSISEVDVDFLAGTYSGVTWVAPPSINTSFSLEMYSDTSLAADVNLGDCLFNGCTLRTDSLTFGTLTLNGGAARIDSATVITTLNALNASVLIAGASSAVTINAQSSSIMDGGGGLLCTTFNAQASNISLTVPATVIGTLNVQTGTLVVQSGALALTTLNVSGRAELTSVVFTGDADHAIKVLEGGVVVLNSAATDSASTYGTAFAWVTRGGTLQVIAAVTGTATGKRYVSESVGLLIVEAGASPPFPGTIAGTGPIIVDSGTIVPFRLQQSVDLYCDPTGSDNNDGSSGSPFATIQHAINVLAANYDFAGIDSATINLSVSTFTESVNIPPMLNLSPPVNDGGCSLIIQGNGATIDGAIQLTGAGSCLYITNAEVTGGVFAGYFGFAVINACSLGGPVYAFAHSRISVTGGVTFLSTITQGIGAYDGSYVQGSGSVTGTPAVTVFAEAVHNSTIVWGGVTGTATGLRFNVASNSHIDTGGAGANAFPGNSAGTADGATGGYYT